MKNKSIAAQREYRVAPTPPSKTAAAMEDILVLKDFHDGEGQGLIVTGRPTLNPSGDWQCRVRIERGSGRIEQVLVVAPSEREVVRRALEHLTTLLAMTHTQFFDDTILGLRGGSQTPNA